MGFNYRYFRKSGFSLLEFLFAITILTVAAIFLASSFIYANRANVRTMNNLRMVMVANDYQSRVMASNFNRLGETDVTSGEYENQFTSAQTVNSDPQFTSSAPNYEVTFEFTGFGTVQSATVNSLKMNTPSNQTAWTTNEWKNHVVYIRDPGNPANGQIMKVVSNDADTLSLTRDLGIGLGGLPDEWIVVPTAGTQFYIDDAKTVYMTVSSSSGQTGAAISNQTITRKVMLRN